MTPQKPRSFLVCVALLGGCAAPPPALDAGTDAGAVDAGHDAGSDPYAGDGGVIQFTQADGCFNDGSVEFCLPNDQMVLAKVMAINPVIYEVLDSRGQPTSTGRAKCDITWEHLYFFPTPPDDTSICLTPNGAMSDAAWNQILELAKIPEIRAIVPTFY